MNRVAGHSTHRSSSCYSATFASRTDVKNHGTMEIVERSDSESASQCQLCLVPFEVRLCARLFFNYYFICPRPSVCADFHHYIVVADDVPVVTAIQKRKELLFIYAIRNCGAHMVNISMSEQKARQKTKRKRKSVWIIITVENNEDRLELRPRNMLSHTTSPPHTLKWILFKNNICFS